MKWNPLLSAVSASAYIGAIASFMQFIGSIRHDTPDTIYDVMGVFSLFTFSAAVMAFLFFYQPILKLIEGKKGEAVSYFLKTIGIFGLITVAILALVSLQ